MDYRSIISKVSRISGQFEGLIDEIVDYYDEKIDSLHDEIETLNNKIDELESLNK